MGPLTFRVGVLVVCALLSGCSLFGKRKTNPMPPSNQLPVTQQDRLDRDLLAMANGTGREPTLPDPATMIPPRPMIQIPDIPEAPSKDDQIAVAPKVDTSTNSIKQVSAVKGMEDEQAKTETPIEALQRLKRTAQANFNKLEGFTAKLTRRETVGGQPHNEEVLQYKFRVKPYSMHLRWIGREAQGRELVYVAGTKDDKVHILTARGDGALLMPAGRKFAFPPTASEIRSQARYDIREGGMGLSIAQFARVVDLIEQDPTQAKRMRYQGLQKRIERAAKFELVEETIPPNWEPLLPKGGRRMTYFDPEPSSPSFGLPILVITFGDNQLETEYYWFDQFKPANFTDADFDPNRLWRK